MKKIDITKHVLIPKHTKLSDKEKAEVLKRYNIGLANLPKISKDDSGISRLASKVDDVIKITRTSPTAGEAIFYRVVVNA